MASETWTDTSGEWGVGTLWSPSGPPGLTDSATLASTATYTVTVGVTADVSDTAGNLLVSDPTAILDILAGSTLSVPGAITLTAGELALGGVLADATLLTNGGSFHGSGGTLSGVTIDGSIDAGSGLDIVGNLAFAGAGSGAGTLSLNGADVTFSNSTTLGNAVIEDGLDGGGFLIDGSLTFASNATLVLPAANAGNPFDLDGSFVNDGTIQVAANGLLEVTGGAFTNNGVVTFGPGGTLLVDGGNTAQLISLAGLAAAGGAVLELTGTLNNATQTLNLSSGPLTGLIFADGAEVSGGTLMAPPGFLAGSPTLSGVTVLGPLSLGTPGQQISLLGGATFDAVGGGLGGVINLDAGDNDINVLDAETLNNLQVNLAASADGSGGIFDPSSSLTLGANTTLDVATAGAPFEQNIFTVEAPSLVNQGAIDIGAASAVDIQASSFANAGSIAIGTGGTLLVRSGSFTDSGPIALGAGGLIGLFQTLTTAQLLALAGDISGTGGTVALDGTLTNTSLTAAGALANLVLGGVISGGTVIAPAASEVIAAGGSLVGVAYDGVLDIPGSSGLFSLAGNVTFAGAGGTGQGTIAVSGSEDTLLLNANPLLDDVVVENASSQFAISSSSSLTLGPHFALTTTGAAKLSGTQISNTGTLAATGAAGAILLGSNTIANSGAISVAADGTLALGLPIGGGASAPLSLTGAGSISVGAGGTVFVGGSLTTAGLLSLLTPIVVAGNNTVVLDGTLNNSAPLTVGPGALIGNLILAGDIVGGTITSAGGLVAAAGGTLDDLTILGTLAAPFSNVSTTIRDGIALDQAGGAPGGTLFVTGSGVTFTGATISLPAGTVELFGGDDIIGSSTSSLTLGAAAAVMDSGNFGANFLVASTLTNGGTISVAGSGLLDLTTNALTNTGTILVGAGDEIGILNSSTLTLTDPGAIQINPLGSLRLGGAAGTETNAELVALTAGDTGITTRLFGTLLNTGSIISVGSAVSIGTLDLDGDVVGGTIIAGAGSTIKQAGGTLTGVTYDGLATFTGTDNNLDIAGGFTLNQASGAPVGTLIASGTDDSVLALDTETFNNLVLDVSDPGFVVSGGTLGIGSNVTGTVTGGLAFAASTFSNAGTFVLSTPGAALALDAPTISNSGFISIGSTDLLKLDFPGSGGALALVNSGLITIAAGGTIEIGGTYTPAQLAAIAAFGGPGVEIVLGGTLLNAGNDLIAAGALSELELDGDIQGGTISVGAGTVTALGGTLADVVYQGTLALAPDANVEVVGSLTLESAAGGLPGTLASTGGGSLAFFGSGSLDNAAILQSGGVLGINASRSLGLGPDLDLVETGGAVGLSAGTLTNAGTLLASSGSVLSLESGSIVNTGTILAAPGAALLIDPTIDPSQGALSVVNADVMTVASGGTLAVGGFETTAYLQSLVGSISSPGVLTILDGDLNNAGTTLPLAGLLDDVVLAGTISGGTVVANADTVATGADPVLVDVAYDGGLDIGGSSQLTVYGGLDVAGPTGSTPGTIELTGAFPGITFADPADVLAGEFLLLAGQGGDIYAANLTLAASSSARVTGVGVISGSSFTNAGSIGVTGDLLLESSSFSNSGTITAAAGALLQLGLFGSGDGDLGTLGIGAVGSIAMAAGSTLGIGGLETTAQLLALVGAVGVGAGVTLKLDGTIENAGSVLALTGNDVLAGTVVGGTLVTATTSPLIGGLSTIGGPAALIGVTVDGPLTLGLGSDLAVSGGLTVIPATGPVGIIDVTGAEAVLSAADTETFNQILIDDTGRLFSISSGGSLAFGAAATLEVGPTASTAIDAAAFTNDGTLAVSGTASALAIDANTFINNGVITIGSSDVLALGAQLSGVAETIAGTGSFVFAPGSTLDVGGSLTTAQLLTLLGSVVGTQTGVTVVLDGTVDNTGATLASVAGTDTGNLILDATIQNGTIATGGGSVSVAGGAFSGVTYQGPLVLGSDVDLTVRRGLTLQAANGAQPGTIAVTGSFDALDFTDSETLSKALLSVGGSGFELIGPSGGTLTLDPSLTSAITGQVVVAAGTIVNGMNVALTTPGSAFQLDSNTITNTATITAAAQTVFGVGAAPGALFSGGTSTSETPITLNSPGPISLAAGVTLAIGGRETDAQIAALVGSLAPQAGELILGGIVLNAGSVLTVPATGAFANLLLDGAAINGGSIVDAGGTIGFGNAVLFQTVAFDGPLDLTGSLAPDLIVTGGLDLLAPAGGTATITIGGTFGAALTLDGTSQTLTGVDISIATVPGAGSLVTSGAFAVDGGTVTLASGDLIAVGGRASLLALGDANGSGTIVNQGSIAGGGALTIGSTTGSVEAESVFSGVGEDFFEGSFINAGNIGFDGGTMSVVGPAFSNTGLVQLTGDATLVFTADPAAAGTIDVSVGGETVAYATTSANAGVFSASLLRFGDGDIFDLPGLAPAGVTATLGGSILTVANNGNLVASLTLSGPTYTQGEFTVGTDAAGFADIVSTAPCFCAGTRILTETGPRAIETLCVGERVVTRSGGLSEIVWIGERQVDIRRHAHPERVRPVRIRAGAFADGVPMRDLLVSPDHAIFVRDVLVPARYLVNGATVVDEADCTRTHYFHVELARHDILLAEGLPAESYLDTGNRAQFSTALHPDFAPYPGADPCAPLCLAGAVLAQVRGDLLTHAEQLGHRRQTATDLWLSVGGRRRRATSIRGRVHSFMLPAGTRSVRVLTSSAVPAELDPTATDRRRLGAAIGGVVVNGRSLPLDGPVAQDGFHACETGWRWTDGDAGLDLTAGGGAGPVVLELLVRGLGLSWAGSEFLSEEKNQKTVDCFSAA